MKFFLLTLVILGALSCSSTSSRDPASVEKEKEESHQKFQGIFDRPN